MTGRPKGTGGKPHGHGVVWPGLRRARVRAGFTSAQAGSLIGLSAGAYIHIENGRAPFRVDQLLTLAAAWGATLEELTERNPPRPT